MTTGLRSYEQGGIFLKAMRHLTIAALSAALLAAILVPASASAQRSCQPAGSPRCQNAERFQDKRDQMRERLEQRRDAARGVTPACRAAHERWEDGVEARARRPPA